MDMKRCFDIDREKTEKILIKKMSCDMITASKELQNFACYKRMLHGIRKLVVLVIISNADLEFAILKGE